MQRATEASPTKRSQSGFTLLELMITLAVAGVIVGLAVPTMRTFGQNNKLAGASNDLLRSFQIARSEAIKRQQNVVVCATTDPTAANPVCSYGTVNFKGWIVFQDSNGNWQSDGDATEPVIERHGLLDTTLNVRNDKNGIESYNSQGFANPKATKDPTRNIVICDKRGVTLSAGSSTARAIVISNTGRTLVTKDNTAVTAAAGQTGACP